MIHADLDHRVEMFPGHPWDICVNVKGHDLDPQFSLFGIDLYPIIFVPSDDIYMRITFAHEVTQPMLASGEDQPIIFIWRAVDSFNQATPRLSFTVRARLSWLGSSRKALAVG